MHEPVEILSPSRRSSLLSFEFSFSLSFSFCPLLPPVSPFYFSFYHRVFPPPSLPRRPLLSRCARLLATFEFNFLTQSGDAEKHLRAIKDRRWKVQTMVKKKGREKEEEG